MSDFFTNHFTRRHVRFLAISTVVIFTAFFLYLRITATHGIDRMGNPLAPDLGQFYVAGQMAEHGEWRQLYDPSLVWHRINDVLGRGQETGTSFFYPPFVPWFCIPLIVLPFALCAWVYFILSLMLGFGLGWLIPQRWAAARPDAREACWLFVASVPFWRCVLFGQNGLISLALLWGFYRAWEDKKFFWGGLLLAAGAYKPQIFLGAWIWLILFGPMRARVGFVAGLGFLFLLGSYGCGFGIWTEWFNATQRLHDLPGSSAHMHSLRNAFELIMPGGGGHIEGLLWLLFLVIWVWALLVMRLRPSTETNPGISMSVALLGWGLLTPRLYQYDLVIFYPLLVGWWTWIRSLSVSLQPRWIIGFIVVMASFYLNDFAAGLKLPILTVIGIVLFGMLLCNIFKMNIKRN